MARRANNEGGVYWDDKLKRYIGQFSYIDSATGKRKRKKITGIQKRKVIEAGKAFLKQLKSNAVNSKIVLLKDFINKWLENTVRPTVRLKTYERYECAIRCHVEPKLGNLPLTEINREILQIFFTDLKESGGCKGGGLSASTINGIRRLLKTAFNVAVADGLIAVNPVEQTRAMRVNKREIKIFSREDYEKLVEVARMHSDKSYLIILIAFATGFRIGEIFGLEYDSVDFDNKKITVKQTVVSTRHGKKLQKMAKNSNSIRCISVSENLIEKLRYYYEKHKERKALLKNKYEQEHDFIIENEDGSFCDPAYFTDKVFKKILLKKAGLSENFRMHDCRHTHASWLISRGVKPIVVSKRLGHKSIRTTMDIYSHLLPSLENEAVEALKDIL